MSTNHFEQPRTASEAHQLAHTRHEAARMLGISANSLDRLVARGLLRPCRALRRPIFPLTELQRFLAETK